MIVFVTRDSVAAGDDVESPHLLSIDVENSSTLMDVFEHLEHLKYLPWVCGRGHSWQAFTGDRIVARFAINKRQPEPSKHLQDPLTSFVAGERICIHFVYNSAAY